MQQNLSTKFTDALTTVLAAASLSAINALDGKNEEATHSLVQRQKKLIETYFDQNNLLLKEAIERFKERDGQGVLKELFDRLAHGLSQKGTTRLLDKLYKESNTLEVLMAYAGDAFEEQKWSEAQALFTLIATLYPFYVRPYLFLAKIEWQLDGITKAVAVYDSLTSIFNDPELNFCAAECFWHAGAKEKTLRSLNETVRLLQQKQGALNETEQTLLKKASDLIPLVQSK